MFTLISAFAAAPLDADGAYVHVATLPLFTMHSPNILQRSLQVTGHAPDPDGGLWFVHGFGEIAHFTPEGRLEREAYRHVLLDTMGIQGPFHVSDGTLTYYEMPHGIRRADLSTGAVEPVLPKVDPPAISGLYALPGDQWWLANLQMRTARPLEGGAWGAPVPLLPLRGGEIRDGASRVVPCGASQDGTPLSTLYDGETAELMTLTPQLTYDEPIWTSKMDHSKWGASTLDGATSCAKVGNRVLLSTNNQVFVFDGTELVSAIRGGAGPDARFPEYGATGPYAFENLLTTELIGDGELVVALERQSSLKVFARRLDNPQKALAQARKQGDSLGLVRAGATGDERFAALWDLGWWESLEKEAGAAGDETWRARARARQIVFWARTGPPSETYMGPGRMEQLDGTYLTEVEAELRKQPDEAWLLYAQALLLDRLGRATDATAALVSLEGALPGRDLSVKDVPELFELAASRGDLTAMKRMHDGIDPAVAPHVHVLWAARIARVEGQPGDGLAILKGLPADDRDALVLRARLHADAGALDQAISTWLKAQSTGDPDDPAVHAGLGVAYLERGLVELAVESLLKAVNGDPGTPAHKSNLAAALAAQDKKSDALKQLYAALGDDPEDPLLQHQLKNAMGGAEDAATGGDVAVLPFQVAGGAVERVGLGDMFASLASTRLVNEGVGVVERARIDALFAEQDLQRTAYVDPTTAVQVGKVAGAAWIVTGTVSEFADRLVFDVRRVNVQTGKVAAAARGEAPLELEPLEAALDGALAKVRP